MTTAAALKLSANTISQMYILSYIGSSKLAGASAFEAEEKSPVRTSQFWLGLEIHANATACNLRFKRCFSV